MTRLRFAPALLVLLLIASCGTDPVGPEFGPLTGLWSAVAPDSSFVAEMGIRAPGTGSLTGCARVGFDPRFRPNDRVVVEIVGDFAGDSLSVGPAPGYASIWTFEGARIAEDSISGLGWAGEGGGATRLTFRRESSSPGC